LQRELNIVSHSEEQTLALARKLAPHLRDPEVVVLTGALGSGKTVFVRGLATALGIKEYLVRSASFTMVNEYPGQKNLFHLDLYRLGDPSELYEIGWDEYLGREGLFVVEWGEKAGDHLPAKYYQIRFTIINENARNITVSLIQP
jgi:tRNA threonylcarbamoyladenosine biosynthesis protein TsaE